MWKWMQSKLGLGVLDTRLDMIQGQTFNLPLRLDRLEKRLSELEYAIDLHNNLLTQALSNDNPIVNMAKAKEILRRPRQ